MKTIQPRESGGFVLGVNRGTIQADQVVIAAGPFSGKLAASAGVNLPLKVMHRHKVVVPDLPRVPAHAPMTIDDDTGTHWRPALGGAYVLDAAPRGQGVEPTEDVPPDSHMAFAILDPQSPTAAARISPFWGQAWRRGELRWMVHSGQYMMTPDHRPLIGETALPGLWVNTGYSGHGIMCSPAAGRILADLITSRTQVSPFALGRTFVKRSLDQIWRRSCVSITGLSRAPLVLVFLPTGLVGFFPAGSPERPPKRGSDLGDNRLLGLMPVFSQHPGAPKMAGQQPE